MTDMETPEVPIDPSLDRLYGKVSTDQFFSGDLHVAPFSKAGGLKGRQPYDPEVVSAAINQDPPELVDIDPRTLKASQSHVTKGGVSYYDKGHYETTGETYADQDRAGNRFPVVYSRTHNDITSNIILSGHHRATSALLRGEPLRALNPRGGFGPEIKKRP